jgi:hypothetical protein
MKHGDWAWCAIMAGVIAYEIKAPTNELLSQACDRYRKRHPVLTNLAIVYVAAHLMRRWPSQIDPLHQLTARMGR